MSILMINSSPHHEGNTVHMAQQLLTGRDVQYLHLNDFALAQLGQTADWDQFEQVFKEIDRADLLVFGTPIYWHDMTGTLKLLIDRISEDVSWEQSHLAGKSVILIAQGFSPGKTVLAHCDNVFQQLCGRIGMSYLGMVSNPSDIKKYIGNFNGDKL